MATERQRRDVRASEPAPMRLTERDKQIIKAVCDFRVLRQDQLQTLFFPSKNTAQRALARLYHHGYLARLFWPVVTGSPPTLYVLDRKAVDMLKAEFGYNDLRWFPTSRALKGQFLEHTSAINDFRIAISFAAQKRGYTLAKWVNESQNKGDYDWVKIRTASGFRKVSLIPDSYLILETPLGRGHFFLELDRGTMSTKRFQAKIQAYLAYRESGEYERRYKAKTVRVLTVTLGEKRLAHLKEVTEAAGGKSWFWFGVLSQLDVEHVLSAPVWQKAGQDGFYTLVEPLA